MTNNIINGLDNNVMPIGAYVSPTPTHKNMPNKKSFIDDAHYKDLHECGINFIHQIYENFQEHKEDVLLSLDLSEKYNIRVLVMDNDFFCKYPYNERFLENYNIYSKKLAFAGMNAIDEPSRQLFEEIKKRKLLLNKIDSSKTFWINLFAMYAPVETLYGKVKNDYNYKQYIDDFINVVNPPYLSYDLYPMRGEFPNININHFNQLSYIRRKSLEHDIPFWVFIQCTTWHKDVRMPIDCEIYYQVTTALAYGAKGIQYFCYSTPINGDVPEGENFFNAVLDIDGKKTTRYFAIKEINKHINAVSKILMNCKSLGIVQIGGTSAELPYDDRCMFPKIIDKIDMQHGLVGVFKEDLFDVIYIVNNSIEEDTICKIEFFEKLKFILIEENIEKNYCKKNIETKIKKGQAVLIKVQF